MYRGANEKPLPYGALGERWLVSEPQRASNIEQAIEQARASDALVMGGPRARLEG